MIKGCSQTFTGPIELKEHQIHQHHQIPCNCEGCYISCGRKSDMERHYKNQPKWMWLYSEAWQDVKSLEDMQHWLKYVSRELVFSSSLTSSKAWKRADLCVSEMTNSSSAISWTMCTASFATPVYPALSFLQMYNMLTAQLVSFPSPSWRFWVALTSGSMRLVTLPD
jgi:hypothetical protein